ncbi:orcokinin peptides type A [Trichonephila clavata]|uniref:Orcokinin peptides type A n=1 Tax=Trichonephila clavata TaxID=2740835 RepID=A0A8X6H2C6_TRICU|nr:orcokinin peptides type A [Trichonephila clavata]
MRDHGGARQNLLRLAREDKSSRVHLDFNGADVIRSLLASRSLDRLGGGEVIRILDPLTGGLMLKSLDQLSTVQGLNSLDNFRGGEVLSVLDRLTGGDFVNSLDLVEGVTVLGALEKARQAKLRHKPSPKRTLDTLTGMAFGESKRFDSLSGSTFGLSKRDFDEIDNVGFHWLRQKRMGILRQRKGQYLGPGEEEFRRN